MHKIITTAAVTVGLAAGAVSGYLLKKFNTKRSKPIITVEPGDMIQWESSGAFVFPEPRKVTQVHDSEMGIYVFVEGSYTGIPVDQVVVIKRG